MTVVRFSHHGPHESGQSMLTLHPSGTRPLYEQITERLQREIAEGDTGHAELAQIPSCSPRLRAAVADADRTAVPRHLLELHDRRINLFRGRFRIVNDLLRGSPTLTPKGEGAWASPVETALVFGKTDAAQALDKLSKVNDSSQSKEVPGSSFAPSFRSQLI